MTAGEQAFIQDLQSVHRFFSQMLAQGGKVALLNFVSDDYTEELHQLKHKLGEHCQALGICYREDSYWQPRGESMRGVELVEAVRYSLQGSCLEYLENKREIIEHAPISPETRTVVLGLLQGEAA
ncbi:hypothetical protein [Deinococcus roseus]|uniref:Uncharacterized protein n=1 Tax=Deinococcus roseus TaxID=392414 RepID=A0ABQ2DIA6_9DEIO|nr:hypothetical protein [Deinococcus roseus]GGJ55767.1 hypothetical protein GCM10008938_47440 [Deinococcus roseus]